MGRFCGTVGSRPAGRVRVRRGPRPAATTREPLRDDTWRSRLPRGPRVRPRAPPASSPEFTSDGADSIEGPARFVRETNSDGADTFLTRLNLLDDEPLADALLLRVGRLEAVLESVADLLHGELLLLRIELVEQ